MDEEKPKATGKKDSKGTTESVDAKPLELAMVSAEAFAKGYEQCLTLTCEQVGRLYPAAAGKLEELADFGKGNLEAWLLAGSKAAMGWEALSAEIMGCNKKLWENNLKSVEALAGCENLEDIVSLQSEAFKAQYDTVLEEGSKLGELTATIASAAVEPINQRLGQAADKFTKPIAA